jgi:GNAT superfamily N-acetyltransferase
MSRAEDDNKVATPISEESWTGRSGARLTLRLARGADQVGLRTFIDGLSRESRYFRFLTGGRVADEIIQGFVSHPSERDVALVVTSHDEGGRETIVANAEYVVNEEGVAELAVVVADAWQGQGLGRRLIQRLQQLARNGRLRGMRGDVLSENRRMLAIMRDCGFTARRNPEDSFLHEVSLTLADARTPTREHLMQRDWFAAN